MKRRGNSTSGLSSDVQAWLRGDPNTGFFQFKHDDELEAVWLEYGDREKMHWRRDMAQPITLEELESFESEWLNSAKDDEYGHKSFFVGKYYSDDEKQALWAERGDKHLYRWIPGMRKPEAVN